MDEKIPPPPGQTTAPVAEAASGSNDGHTASGFPSEPFPCPYCGQMLAPTVRVCVACRHSIHPRDIVVLPATPPPSAAAPPQARGPRFAWMTPAPPRPGEVQRVQFSLPTFLMVLAIALGIATLALKVLGPVKSQYVMPGLVLFSSIWVYLDAYHRKLPKPLQWAIGSLLVWIVVFPWYIARRRLPNAACPLIEMDSRRFFRAILVLLFVGFLFSVLLQYLRGPLK